MSKPETNELIDKINTLLGVMEKHLGENDCQHSFKEVFGEYILAINEVNKRGNDPS